MVLKGIVLITAFIFGMPSMGQVIPKAVRLATQTPANALTEQGLPYIRCAMEELKQPYTVESIPWKRAQKATEQGHYNGFFMASKTKKRDKYATLSQPFIVINWFYVTKKNRYISPQDSDFYSRKFVANLGSARHQWLQGLVENGIINSEIETPVDEASSLKMLMLDRVDVALINSIQFDELIERLFIKMKELTLYTAKQKPTGVYFSHTFIKQNPKFLQKFNLAIETCKNNFD